MMQYEIIRRPLITEKTSIQKEIANQLTFEVDRRANRIEIKRAIETAFKVRVASVKTMQVKGKRKQRGRIIGSEIERKSGALFGSRWFAVLCR